MADVQPRMVFLGFGKYARADRIYALEPDEATERHYHRLSEEIYFVVKGSGDLEVDGEHKRFAVGDAVLIPPGAWHTLWNNGTSELRILCCCVPPYSHDDTYFE